MQFIPKRSRRLLDNLDESQDLPIKANPRASMHITTEPRSPTPSSPNFWSTGHSRASASNSQHSTTSFEVLDQHPDPGHFQLSPMLKPKDQRNMSDLRSSVASHQIKKTPMDSPLAKLRIPREPQPTSVCTCDRHQTCHQCFGVWPSRREIIISFYAFPGHL